MSSLSTRGKLIRGCRDQPPHPPVAQQVNVRVEGVWKPQTVSLKRLERAQRRAGERPLRVDGWTAWPGYQLRPEWQPADQGHARTTPRDGGQG